MKKAALALCIVVCIFAGWQFTKWGLANSAASRADDVEIAEYLTTLAPSDPQPHYAAAVLLERSFDLGNVEKALQQLEAAVALSPNNYLLWLELGRARDRSGDAAGAEGALRRALELAPNYSRVQWALGNNLLRQGRTDEAFAEIRKAVLSDPTFADAAATAAWQFFDGDVPAIRRVMEGSVRFDGALVAALVRANRFEEAIEIWNGIPAAEKQTTLKDSSAALSAKFLEAKKFRYALSVASETSGERPETGQVRNGGFESAVKNEGAGVFEWQITAGLQPQIVLSGGQKHGGSNSLYFIFNSNNAADFRPVSQTVVVEPGASYEIEIFYRSELKTSAEFRWDILDAVESKRLAVTDPISVKAEWTPLKAAFTVPANSDGVTVRFIREACSQVCSVSGNLWFDDISIRRVQR